ncbi:MAG: MBL fold metallo-hydrolase [Patescibacteria group bacterium]
MEKAVNKRQKLLVLVLCLLVIFVGLVFVFSQFPDQDFHLVFCDVGQGDAVLIYQGTSQILVDGGSAKNSDRLLKCLQKRMPFWDRKIELVINTHPDEDHFGGLTEIVDRYRVGLFAYNGFDNPESKPFQELKNNLFESKVCSRKLVAGDVFRVGEIRFDSLSPRANGESGQKALPKEFFSGKGNCQKPNFEISDQDSNDLSLVLQVSFGQFKTLLTGDAPVEIEQLLVWRKQLVPVEVLKLGHHGSKTSTSEEILTASRPQLAVISVGENSFGHPTKEVLERLEKFNLKYLRTDQKGDIEIVSDGTGWSVAPPISSF